MSIFQLTSALRWNGGEDEEVAIEAGQLCGMATHPMEPHGWLPTKRPEGERKLVHRDGILLPLESLLGPPALVHEREGGQQAPQKGMEGWSHRFPIDSNNSKVTFDKHNELRLPRRSRKEYLCCGDIHNTIIVGLNQQPHV